jgi:hypothetical protein
MKQNTRTSPRYRGLELRQHAKTPPSLHALIDLARELNSALDDEFPLQLPISEIHSHTKCGTLTHLLEKRLGDRIDFSSFFTNSDQRITWDFVLCESAQSISGVQAEIGVTNSGITYFQAIIFETIRLYYIHARHAALIAWPGNVN